MASFFSPFAPSLSPALRRRNLFSLQGWGKRKRRSFFGMSPLLRQSNVCLCVLGTGTAFLPHRQLSHPCLLFTDGVASVASFLRSHRDAFLRRRGWYENGSSRTRKPPPSGKRERGRARADGSREVARPRPSVRPCEEGGTRVSCAHVRCRGGRQGNPRCCCVRRSKADGGRRRRGPRQHLRMAASDNQPVSPWA